MTFIPFTMEKTMLNGRQSNGLTVAVTGANGFIGRRLVELLSARQGDGIAELRSLVRRSKRGPTSPGLKVIALRLDDAGALYTALKGCDAVVHCAFDFDDMAANLPIMRALTMACAATQTRLIHISSAAVYEPFPDGDLDETTLPQPSGVPYRDTKIALEAEIQDHVRRHALKAVILQPTAVYGPFGRAWTEAPIRELLTGQVVLPDYGLGLCNPLYIDDLCQAAIAALDADIPSGDHLLVSGPEPVFWRDFLGAYQTILGVDALRFRPYQELVSDSGGTGTPGLKSRVKSALKNNPAAHAFRRIAAGLLDHNARAKLKTWLQRAKAGRGEIVHLPSAPQLALYSARCTVRIEKAQQLLNYAPRFDLEHGMATTAPFIRSRFAAEIALHAAQPPSAKGRQATSPQG
jgi:nucleoside-diphosphate-sugar epimerase